MEAKWVQVVVLGKNVLGFLIQILDLVHLEK